jgi:hypothetical protein
MVDPDDDDLDGSSAPGSFDDGERGARIEAGDIRGGAADGDAQRRAEAWLAEVRELRNSERAPDAVCEQVLENVQRELGVHRTSVGRAPSFEIELSRKGLFEEGLFEKAPFERGPLANRTVETRGFAQRIEALFAAETRPLLARLAGAALLVSLVVVAFGDVRREAGGDGPAEGDATGGASGESKLDERPPVPDFRDEPSYPNDAVVSSRGDVAVARGGNLLTNGDFSSGDVLWSVRQLKASGDLSADAGFAVREGALCGVVWSGEYVLGGWPFGDRRLSPNSFEIVRGARYRLSLRAWSPGPKPVDLVVKVGHQEAPFAASLVAVVPVGATPERFDVEFVARGSDDNAGFAFIGACPLEVGRGELCLDDVVFQEVGL